VYAFLKPCRLTDACATCGVLLRPCPIVARGFAVIQFGTDMAHQYANGGTLTDVSRTGARASRFH
jgi:hypothetical protein